MYIGKISFTSLPDIGFAIRHYSRDYKVTYGRNSRKCVEIAYINSGGITLTYNGIDMYAPEGSIAVIFRHLPISTSTVGDAVHSHDTVLGEFDDLSFEPEEYGIRDEDDVIRIPFVTMPSEKTEKVGLALRKIGSELAKERENKSFASSIAFVSILKELSDIYSSRCDNTELIFRKTVVRIKNYIDNNIEKKITISDIAEFIGKSPNYTGQIFRKNTGMKVSSYVNLQKAKKISLLIKSKEMSFKEACKTLAITDETYGYRIFKKFIGLTPGEFLNVKSIERDNTNL